MRTKPALILLCVGFLLALNISPFVVAEENGEEVQQSMTRIMMMPPEAEVTGMYVDANGHFFVNAMHPDEDNYKATIGVINGIDWNNLPEVVPELDSSSKAEDIWHGIRTSYGDYQVILQTGDALSQGGVAGGIYSVDDGGQILISKKPDFNAFVPINADGTHGYLYTAWEDRPAGLSQMEIELDTTTSEWTVLGGKMLNLSSIDGAWVLCFGSMSPWGSPLFSEELYFDNTQYWNDDSFRYHSDQMKLENYLGYYPNPYDYGYIIEIGNSSTSEPDLTRHLTMGRYSHENAMVMPDERTVYLTDDGYDTVLFKFVADTAGDLSSGTLYASKVAQDDTRDSAITGFDVEWIEMASSSNSEIRSWIEDYDGITTDDFISGQNSYISDEEINDWAEGRLNKDLNGDGIVGYALDDRVAFLESRKAAAAIEATDEWNKMEGVAFNENVPEYLYLAMSRIESAMTDGVGDIDLTLNSCGIVYRMTMGEQWNVNRIDPVISGGPYTSSAQYECDINNLAGPDNILVLDDGRVLVGEDTDKHESNMVWLWEDLSEPLIPNGTLSVNYVNLMNTPADKNSTWDYRFQTEVNDLEIGSSYTAIIIIKEFGFDDWKGIWWWNTIEVDGQQYDQTFSLPRGCYSVSASLYESQDLSSDVKNATILSDTKFDFVVGTGTCTDGIYSEEVAATNETGNTDDGIKDSADESVPGFGILVSIVSILGAIVVTHRRK